MRHRHWVKFAIGLAAGIAVLMTTAGGNTPAASLVLPSLYQAFTPQLAKGDPDPNAEPALESVRVSGAVTVPAGSPAGLKILSSTSESPVTAGGYQVDVVHAAGRPTLQFAANALGNPVLAGVYMGAGAPIVDLNAASTAFALAFYDQAILELPDATRSTAADLVRQHPGLPALQAAVTAALLASPDDPLNGETHPELYEQGVAISAAVLSAVLPGASAAAVMAAAADDGTDPASYVHVNDDANNRLADVKLFNGSFAHYGVSCYLDGAPFLGTDVSPVFLWRRRPSSFTWTWPPEAGVERTLSPGDGPLEFRFKMDRDVTAFDFLFSLASHSIGFGGSSPGKLEANYRLFMSGGAFALAAVKEFAFATAPQGALSWTSAGERVWRFASTTGYEAIKFTVTFVLLAEQQNIKDAWVPMLAKWVGNRAFFAVTAGYAAYELGSMVWSAVNGPETYTESGPQTEGWYPARITVDVEGDTTKAGDFDLTGTLSPGPTPVDVSFQVDGANVPSQLGSARTFQATTRLEAGIHLIVARAAFGDREPVVSEKKVVVIAGTQQVSSDTLYGTLRPPFDPGGNQRVSNPFTVQVTGSVVPGNGGLVIAKTVGQTTFEIQVIAPQGMVVFDLNAVAEFFNGTSRETGLTPGDFPDAVKVKTTLSGQRLVYVRGGNREEGSSGSISIVVDEGAGQSGDVRIEWDYQHQFYDKDGKVIGSDNGVAGAYIVHVVVAR